MLKVFTDQLNNQLAKKNITKENLKDLLSTNYVFVDRLLKGEVDLKLDTMIRISDVIGCKLKITLEDCE